jgi:hypothetical protein
MDIVSESGGGEARFNTYLDALSMTLGHADRAAPFQAYCTGLLLPGDRKSVEPMAARLEPERVQARHQSLHHLVAKAEWSDETMLATVRSQVLPAMERHGAINAWIVDDTGFPKKGAHSVGVARQYCGQLGKQDNCQVAVSLSVANDHASLPIAYRLYLPEAWADDPARRRKAGVPDDIAFRTKPQIALAQIRAALLAGVPSAVVLADAGYGVDTEFRDGITELGLRYVVGIQSSTMLWPPGDQARERLSGLSSVLCEFISYITGLCVQPDQELAGECGADKLLRFAGRAQLLMAGLEVGIVFSHDFNDDEEDGAHALAATAHRPLTGLLAAVACNRRETGELGGGFVGKGADLGHLGDETGNGAIGDAFDRPKGSVKGDPDGVGLDCCGDIGFEGADLAGDGCQNGCERAEHVGVGDQAALVGLHDL